MVVGGHLFIFYQRALPSSTWLWSNHARPAFKKLRLEQRFLPGDEFAARGHLATGLSDCQDGSRCYCIWWVEARQAAKHPATHRTAPSNKE